MQARTATLNVYYDTSLISTPCMRTDAGSHRKDHNAHPRYMYDKVLLSLPAHGVSHMKDCAPESSSTAFTGEPVCVRGPPNVIPYILYIHTPFM